MRTLCRITMIVSLVSVLVSCGPSATSAPTSHAVGSPAAVLDVPDSPHPTGTAVPSPTPFPVANEPAPERTFAKVGSVVQLESTYGISGKAIVAGLQTLIIQGFHYDGKGPRLDIRLVKGEEYENPVAILLELEPRAYRGELLYVIIPSSAGPGTADTIAVYSPETGEAYAMATFD